MLNERGTYALLFSCAASERVQIGALGVLQLAPGWLIYVGSAFGAGGLRARLRHHLCSQAAPHWHLDYARPYLSPCQAWITTAVQPLEHAWAAACQALPGAVIPLRRFGASDCACPAHLFFYPHKPSFSQFLALLNQSHAGQGASQALEIGENWCPQNS